MTIGGSAPVCVIRGMGGNGSTYLSRALSALPSCFVLNECNPRSAHLFAFQLNPLYQLRELEPELAMAFADFDLAELGSPKRFGNFLDRLIRTLAPARRLVVRDYNFADFVASPLAWNLFPASSLDAALKDRARAEVMLVRDPVDQFLSLHRHRVLEKGLAFRAFLNGVLEMLDAFPGIAIVRYEDLFEDFDAQLARILAIFRLPAQVIAPDAIAPHALASGNPRGRVSHNAERPTRDEGAYAALAHRPATRRLLARVRERTGYEA